MNNSLIPALQAITNRINLSTGLTHPNDRNSTLELLKFLYDHDLILNPDEIYIWAIDNGWNANFADDLKNKVIQINEGHNFRIADCPHWNSNFLNSLLNN